MIDQDDKLARFLEFHRENPRVYELFSRFTHEAIARGHEHYSADAIVHRIRWHTSVETAGDDYKINNNYRVFYGRLWCQKNPGHSDFFRTRDSVADGIDILACIRQDMGAVTA